jgi:hypothetical protein
VGRVRSWLAWAAAGACAFLAVLTLFWRDWIEGLTGWDPDRHGGSLEWGLVVALACAAVGLSLLARHWRPRPQATVRPAS